MTGAGYLFGHGPIDTPTERRWHDWLHELGHRRWLALPRAERIGRVQRLIQEVAEECFRAKRLVGSPIARRPVRQGGDHD